MFQPAMTRGSRADLLDAVKQFLRTPAPEAAELRWDGIDEPVREADDEVGRLDDEEVLGSGQLFHPDQEIELHVTLDLFDPDAPHLADLANCRPQQPNAHLEPRKVEDVETPVKGDRASVLAEPLRQGRVERLAVVLALRHPREERLVKCQTN